MNLDRVAIIAEIDAVLEDVDRVMRMSGMDQVTWSHVTTEQALQCKHAIDRFAPKGTTFRDYAGNIFETRIISSPSTVLQYLKRTLLSLKTAYERDQLKSIQELLHANLFLDFLEMAEHLLQQGYKDPAAVTAGGVLEEHLRKLCDKNLIPTTISESNGKTRNKLIDSLNQDLYKENIYGKINMKDIESWAAIRNAVVSYVD